MTSRVYLPSMSAPEQDGSDQLLEPLLVYGCSYWRISSQRAADLYESGVKLWRKEDLADIERQLEQSFTAEKFIVRRIDGSVVHIKNPMFGIRKPIWKPYVKFQEYWRLVRSRPDGPPATYHCTYLVDWKNQTIDNYEGLVDNVSSLFEASRQRWNASPTCEAFTSQFRKLLGGDGKPKKVTKIVCFGLGDLNFKPPDWWRIENDSRPEDERETEESMVEGTFIHHAIALTMADIARSYAGTRDMEVKLLTQDPAYKDETKDMLREIGFEIVGEYGAGGFAELDDECVVISPFAAAPVKQIIADLARPVVVICAEKIGAGVFSYPKKLFDDPESPRTREMWQGYEGWEFPVSSEDCWMDEASLHQLGIYARIGE